MTTLFPPPPMEHGFHASNGQHWAPTHYMPPPLHNGAFIPPQLFHDTLALSKPVERSDEPVLVKALAESCAKGESFKDSLNRLHGTAGHSASLWKDYYLDHKDRIDLSVQTYAASPPPLPRKTIKKPSISTFTPDSSPPRPSPAPSTSRSRKASQQPRTQILDSSGGRRQTINSLTAHSLTGVYNSRLPPPNTELRIPRPPSQSPSPPTRIVPHNRGGHKFTPEDKKFFINFIQWRLKGDPSLVRTELCEELAQKAPHHTAQSWRAYWCSNHDLPDKILARARNDLDQNLTQPRPGMRQQHVYGEHDSDSELSEPPSEEEESDVDDEELEIPTDDESKMGEAGSPYTDADLGCVVRHIASFSNWEDASYKEKWHAFAEKYSQRSHKSWNEYYRRSEKRILQLARKVQKMKSSEPARRTWGMEAKRKLSEEVDGRDAKRNRT